MAAQGPFPEQRSLWGGRQGAWRWSSKSPPQQPQQPARTHRPLSPASAPVQRRPCPCSPQPKHRLSQTQTRPKHKPSHALTRRHGSQGAGRHTSRGASADSRSTSRCRATCRSCRQEVGGWICWQVEQAGKNTASRCASGCRATCCSCGTEVGGWVLEQKEQLLTLGGQTVAGPRAAALHMSCTLERRPKRDLCSVLPGQPRQHCLRPSPTASQTA